jgi:UDPglucose--hexose-1-phosphate uridylyltransferase
MSSPARPHRRLNRLTGEWVVVSPHRTQRPWLGKVESAAVPVLPEYDPSCYLCPGNTRTSGAVNDRYEATFVFPNDFAALLPCEGEGGAGAGAEAGDDGEVFTSREIGGTCRVVCASPRHDLTVARMPVEGIAALLETYRAQTSELMSSDSSLSYVQVFENKGEIMGCSAPHPHSQIWATSFVPGEVAKEDKSQLAWRAAGRGCLLCEVARREVDGPRVIASNDHWVACVPYWATWPYEVLVLPRQCVPDLPGLTAEQTQSLARIMKSVSVRYDNLFQTSFPYSFGFHQAPRGQRDHWHLHAHYFPPLLRSATVRKFMVGFEMLAEAQRDLTPEAAAANLRNVPDDQHTF